MAGLARQTYAEISRMGMNTLMTHRAHGRYAAESIRAVASEATRLEALLSRFIPGSDVSKLNRMAGSRRVRLHRETYCVLERATEISHISQGAFNVTIAPLIALWRAAKDHGEPPEIDAILRTLSLVDTAGIALEPRTRSAMLASAGMAVDLGGIGKGYAADRFLDVFREHGITSAYTNIGGNVAVLGVKPDGSPWRVGIRHPRRDGELIGCICVADRSVVTSGDYQRYFTGSDGRRYHHILDPATGYPAMSGLAAVTVVAESSMDADALSTALFVAGMEAGAALLSQFTGVEAVFVRDDMRVYVTPGLKGNFEASDSLEIKYLAFKKECLR